MRQSIERRSRKGPEPSALDFIRNVLNLSSWVVLGDPESGLRDGGRQDSDDKDADAAIDGRREDSRNENTKILVALRKAFEQQASRTQTSWSGISGRVRERKAPPTPELKLGLVQTICTRIEGFQEDMRDWRAAPAKGNNKAGCDRRAECHRSPDGDRVGALTRVGQSRREDEMASGPPDAEAGSRNDAWCRIGPVRKVPFEGPAKEGRERPRHVDKAIETALGEGAPRLCRI